MSVPQLLVCGDPRHGVARLAGELADAVDALGHPRRVDRPPPRGALHVHFTDRLWGESPEDAARRIRELGERLPLSVTLHDVPQASDGRTGMDRRVRCYRSVISVAERIACNSEHELRLLQVAGIAPPGDSTVVIPLPVWPAQRRPAARRREVALLGWVYPGKGHREAIASAASLGPRPPAVRALGAVVAGHERDAEALSAQARRAGVEFSVSGWLSERDLRDRCATVGVPLAAHAHISASGSIGSWISAGRRPLVADSAYAREIELLRPGTIDRYRPEALTTAIEAALFEEARTFLAGDVDTRPGLDDVARRYVAWWAR